MKTIALCWELGGGFGHLTTLRPVAKALLDRGDRVYLIARNLWSAGLIFQDSGVTLLQAPFRHGQGLQYDKTPTFSYILHNVGFSDSTGLLGLATGWRSLFEIIRPDLILADHSPTALLAARGLKIPAIIWGNGFFCPPNESPLPSFQPSHDTHQTRSVEQGVLDCMNDVLAAWRAERLESVADLYHAGPRRFLLTFAELDHYSERQEDRHRGYWAYRGGVPPEWPKVGGPKIFIYTKHFPRITDVLANLAGVKAPLLVYIDGVDPKLRQRLESPAMRFAQEMVDLRAVAAEAKLAVTNANLGTMTGLLLGGVPQLCLPLTLEQAILAQAVERMGAGRALTPETKMTPAQALREMLDNSRYRAAARKFADKYQGFREDQQLEELLTECDNLMDHL